MCNSSYNLTVNSSHLLIIIYVSIWQLDLMIFKEVTVTFHFAYFFKKFVDTNTPTIY